MLFFLSGADTTIKLHDRFQYALPVIYLLLQRALWVMKEAQSVVLHPRELNVIRNSLRTVWDPINVRTTKLKCECIIIVKHNRPVAHPSLFTQPSSICRTGTLRRG